MPQGFPTSNLSSGDDSDFSLQESFDSNFEDVSSSETEQLNAPQSLLDSDIVVFSDFVLLKFKQDKKKNFYFIGQISAVHSQYDFGVNFLKKK